jgi:Tol biopolymer transport system component
MTLLTKGIGILRNKMPFKYLSFLLRARVLRESVSSILVLGMFAAPFHTGPHIVPNKTHIMPAKDDFAQMPGAEFVIGSRSPSYLILSMPDRILRLLPEPNEQETRTWTPIYPSITRDGRTIAFARVKPGVAPRRVAIATYSVPDRKWTTYMEGEYEGSIAISPDGSRLAFPAGDYTGRPAYANVLDLKTGKLTIGPVIEHQAKMSWAPDGNRLVYEYAPLHPSMLADRAIVSIWDLNTGKETPLVYGSAPTWSPSGEWIAYFDESLTRCAVIHPDGTGRILLARLPRSGFVHRWKRIFMEFPLWSPDSSELLLNEPVDEEGAMNIYLLNFESHQMTLMFKNKAPVLAWVKAR